jgi:nucleoside-diphosphate-sugar epimerase
LQQKYPDAHLEMFVGALSSPEAILPALDGVGVVYHLAAGMKGTAADLFLSSVVASKHLLEAVGQKTQAGQGPKIVLVSSFGVYGVSELPRGAMVDENTPLEPHPEQRDLYSFAKLRQEQLFREYQAKYGFPLVVLRPGVIYGPSGGAFSSRVGLNLFGIFLHLGRGNLLPLSFVENCAEAIVVAGENDSANGQTFNVHDDDLPTSRQYLKLYKRNVKRMRSITVPYFVLQFISRRVERYYLRSKGLLPAIFTPYKTAASWKGNRFSNARLKSLGWRQIVPTSEALRRTFEYLKQSGG